jgi:hypothetical protein
MLAIMLGRGDATAPLPSLPLLSSGPAGAARCAGAAAGRVLWDVCGGPSVAFVLVSLFV